MFALVILFIAGVLLRILRGVRVGGDVSDGARVELPRVCERSGAGMEVVDGRSRVARRKPVEWARVVRRMRACAPLALDMCARSARGRNTSAGTIRVGGLNPASGGRSAGQVCALAACAETGAA